MVSRARRSRRRRQRGAAVFIVVMAITLLTAIGIFAIRSASMVETAAGYNRQAIQTMYLSEYAARSTAAHTSGITDAVVNVLLRSDPEKCLSNGTLALPCAKFISSEIESRVDKEYPGQLLLEPQDTSTEGSLGPALGAAGTQAAQDATFLVELTDPGDTAAKEGFHADDRGLKNVQVTVTALAQIRPFPVGGASGNPWCTAATSSNGASVQTLRAHITLPNKQ
jgi:hypothetical protein